LNAKCSRVLHILDSLRQNSLAAKEANQLQNILLKHFKGEKFKPGRISTNVPQVMAQFPFPFIDLSNNSGAPTIQQQGLRLLHHIFCQKILPQPHRDNGSHQGGVLFLFNKYQLMSDARTRLLLEMEQQSGA
jgi:hypothetical protein